MADSLEFTQSGPASSGGVLRWGNKTYRARSGPFDKGKLPVGYYEVKTRNVAVGNAKNMKSGFIDSSTSKGWFVPIEPQFSVARDGFGIHPDGGTPGTKGCIGLIGIDASAFWKDWLATALKDRPTKLTVK